jgi:CheY-like chemotaxis protein
LRSILAWAHVLRSTAGDVVAKDRAIGEVERSVRVQVKLIDDILHLACVASAEVRLDLQKDPPDKQLAGISVLLAEDEFDLRESLRLVLGDYGAKVTTVASAPEALAALEQFQPDVLLLCDLATRGEAVYDFMRVVTTRSGPVPIASISAWRLDEEARELKAGVRLRLAKPIEVRALVHAVANLAGRTHAKTSP